MHIDFVAVAEVEEAQCRTAQEAFESAASCSSGCKVQVVEKDMVEVRLDGLLERRTYWHCCILEAPGFEEFGDIAFVGQLNMELEQLALEPYELELVLEQLGLFVCSTPQLAAAAGYQEQVSGLWS